MAKIAITGATGNVGAQALSAFEIGYHEITPMARSDLEDRETVTIDVTDPDTLVDAFAGHDAVLHLAANPSPDADWEDVLEPNVDGTYNVYEAAIENDLERVVFASTNHVAHMYNADDPAEPETMADAPRVVGSDEPPRPDSYYGVSKVAGEALGSYYADRHGIEVLNLRIGWLMDEGELAETQDRPGNAARFARAMWLSPRDCRDALRSAVTTADLPENPTTVNVVSRNDERYLPLTETMRSIGYEPRDNAVEELDS